MYAVYAVYVYACVPGNSRREGAAQLQHCRRLAGGRRPLRDRDVRGGNHHRGSPSPASQDLVDHLGQMAEKCRWRTPSLDITRRCSEELGRSRQTIGQSGTLIEAWNRVNGLIAPAGATSSQPGCRRCELHRRRLATGETSAAMVTGNGGTPPRRTSLHSSGWQRQISGAAPDPTCERVSGTAVYAAINSSCSSTRRARWSGYRRSIRRGSRAVSRGVQTARLCKNESRRRRGCRMEPPLSQSR
jgi:hypothetical protein